MKLTKKEIQDLLMCIDLVIQNFGKNKRLDILYDKLFEWGKNEAK